MAPVIEKIEESEVNEFLKKEIEDFKAVDVKLENVDENIERKHLFTEQFQNPDTKRQKVESTKVKDIPCELCGDLFAYRKNLNKHLKRQHVPGKVDRRRKGYRNQKEKPIVNPEKGQSCICDYCGKEFGSKSSLGLHKRLVHDGLKPYSCDECEQTFRAKVQMQDHQVKTHGKPCPYLCPECGKSFLRQRALRQHVSILHLGQRGFECQECGKSFTRLHSLNVHKLTHTNETPYRCEYCSQGFREKRNLLKHLEKLHENTDRDNIFVRENSIQ